MKDFKLLNKYIKDVTNYFSDSKRIKLKPFPKVKFVHTTEYHPLEKTGKYNHKKNTIYIYNVEGRGLIDILRTYAHELIHRSEHLTGQIVKHKDPKDPKYAEHDKHMRKMERKAYEKGSMYLRDFLDHVRYDEDKKDKLDEGKSPIKNIILTAAMFLGVGLSETDAQTIQNNQDKLKLVYALSNYNKSDSDTTLRTYLIDRNINPKEVKYFLHRNDNGKYYLDKSFIDDNDLHINLNIPNKFVEFKYIVRF